MDGRHALAPGAELKLDARGGYVLYTVKREIGRGGSCIVYDASYEDNLGNQKLVRIKECYPHALKITREPDGRLVPFTHDQDAFAAAQNRMIEAYQKNHDLFYLDKSGNTIANSADIYPAYGTVYIVSVYLNGCTFADYQGKMLHDCVQLILSTAGALQRIHEAGYFYLDLKPDNILTVEGSHGLVQLFDFDSAISEEELNSAIQSGDSSALLTSYTKGYAPLEQQTGRLKQLGKHSDLFSLGAVLFYALWHRTPNAFDCEADAAFDFAHMTYADRHFQDRLFRALSVFFHKTLASYYGDRYQDAGEAISQLQEILQLSDETKPWIRSTAVQDVPAFYGRKKELGDLAQFLAENRGQICSLYGMGGIGKSTLARRYLYEYPNEWDAHLWIYDQENLMDAVADDTQIQINTISREKDETAEEYLDRKLPSIGLLAKTQRILLIIDNFTAAHIDQLKPLSQLGITILLISRERLQEGLYPSMQISEMACVELASLFSHYAHCDLSDEDSFRCFQTIAAMIDGHTLLTELIARQVAKSYLDLQAVEAMVAGIGLSDLPEEKIDYIRDQTAYHETLLKILDRLVEADRFTAQDGLCMKLLSLFDMPGIDANLFKELASLPTLDFINDLESSGWLKTEGSMLYLHPMMQEYVRTWPWDQEMVEGTDQFILRLYGMLLPAGKRHDTNRQFPNDNGRFYGLLRMANQVISHYAVVTEASQRLLYRWLMDAPVDQDTIALFRMLDLLDNPKYLDDDSILRLYETAAYYRARLYAPDDAIDILHEMKKYLHKHPSTYYLSAYHKAMSVILINANRDQKMCIRHENKAIEAARRSKHPEAKKLLAACLMEKARTLMSANMNQKQVRKLVKEAGELVARYTESMDEERYQYACNAAMCCAIDGDVKQALEHLKSADAIAYADPDSDLAIAEHLIDEAAPIRIGLEQHEEAEAAVIQAIAICEKHPEALRYRETVFDAFYFLGRIYNMHGKYIKAEEAFAEAEKRVHDSPYVWKLPLCPAEIREKADQERKHKGEYC